MELEKYTTRPQLKKYGVSQYQAIVITKNLEPIGKKGQANKYSLREVIQSSREYCQRPRIKPKTRQILQSLEKQLLQRLGNVIEVPFFRGTDPELSKFSKKLFNAMADADRHLAEMKATADVFEKN